MAQCGGEGNVARFHAAAREVGAERPYAEHLEGWKGPWHFAGAEETAERLERAGFTEIETWLEPYPVTPPDPAGFLRTVCLGPHLEQLPEQLRAHYVDAVCERCGTELDYVRLNMQAKRRA
jgi:trans-aconitate 2-methyltransferase